MASADTINLSPAIPLATTSNTNGVATAQVVNGARVKTILTAICISASAAPAAAVTATLTIAGVAVPIQIPAAAFSPIFINFVRPLRSNDAETVSLSVPALGAAVIGTATLYGFQSGS